VASSATRCPAVGVILEVLMRFAVVYHGPDALHLFSQHASLAAALDLRDRLRRASQHPTRYRVHVLVGGQVGRAVRNRRPERRS
jgi:hypothetical protein